MLKSVCMAQKLNCRWKCRELCYLRSQLIWSIATFMDPRLKNNFIFSSDGVRQQVRAEILRIKYGNDGNNFMFASENREHLLQMVHRAFICSLKN